MKTNYNSKFALLAVRETAFPDPALGLEDEAAAHCIGAIGQAANDRESYINAGLDFLDHFKEMAENAIDGLGGLGVGNDKLIHAIKALVGEADEVDRDIFAQVIAKKWDDAHGDDKGDS